jgi:hypothetical protein
VSLYIDFDGVLFDTLDMSLKATAITLHHYGVIKSVHHLTRQLYLDSFWGKSWQAGLDEVVAVFHGRDHDFLVKAKQMQADKDVVVRSWMDAHPAPVNTGALALLVFAREPVVFCTAGGPNMAEFKASLVSVALARVGSKTQTTLICNVDKTDTRFWKAQDASIVIDDDIRVINAAESVGLRTIHWREFLPKGI